MSVEHKLREAIILCDLGVDADGTLVTELAAELDIVEGDGVMGWLGPMKLLLALSREDNNVAYHDGRMSRSDAISAKLLVTSL